MKALAFFGLFALAACTNTTDPYLAREVCDEWQVMPVVQPQSICTGKTCTVVTTTQLMPVCQKSHVVMYRNPDYKGPR